MTDKMTPRIFVFGSNLRGIHGAGAAKTAAEKYGAEKGVGVGRTGNAYAIPTKVTPWVRMELDEIGTYVKQFVEYATEHPELEFEVTRVGCGLAGYDDYDMAPLFADSPANVHLPRPWRSRFLADD